MSASGALLALQPQLLHWLEREQRVVSADAGARRLQPSVLLETATRGRVTPDAVTLTIASDPSQAAMVSLGRSEIRYVNPYSGALLGEGRPVRGAPSSG